MKTIRFRLGVAWLLSSFLAITAVSAQGVISLAQTASVLPTSSHVVATVNLLQDNPTIAHLDNAVAALTKGDKSATTQELQAGISGLESAAQTQPTSFKDKLLAQAKNLKALLPLIPNGALGNGVLGKAVSLAKLAAGGNQLEGILAAGSLLGKGSQLTSGLSGIGSALSALGGGTQSSGQSLVSTALAAVGKLDQGGLVAKAAEPAAKTQINSVLDFVKGAL